MVMPSKPAPAVQNLYVADMTEEDESEEVMFRLPPGASRNTRRVARYLQKDLHFPELLLMLIFMVSLLACRFMHVCYATVERLCLCCRKKWAQDRHSHTAIVWQMNTESHAAVLAKAAN